MLRWSLCSAVLLQVVVLSAQRPPIFVPRHYGPENGLSNRHVTALLQDDLGFIWAGTVSGLDRFDGHTFRNWSALDGLSAGRVDALRRDRQGKIWVFAFDTENDIAAVDVLDPRNGKLGPPGDLPLELERLVRVGPQRNDGVLVMGARSPAACVIRQRSGRFSVIPLEGTRFEPLGNDGTGAIVGQLWGTKGEQHLVKVDTMGTWSVFRTLEPGTSVEPMITGRTGVGALYRSRDPAGIIRYFDTYSEVDLEGVDERLPQGDPIRRPSNYTPLPAHGLRVLDTRIVDRQGSMLFDLTAAHREVGGRVKDCIVDRSGDPWMATEFGLFQVDVRGDLFERWLYAEEIPEGFGILCRGMDVHAGRLYLSTEWQGSYSIGTEDGPRDVRFSPTPEFLFATHVGEDGTWWRGGPELVVSQDATGEQRSHRVPDKIWSILDQADGSVLLGGLKGLHRLEPTSGEVHALRDPGHPELARAHVLQLTQGTGASVLATTSKGVYRISSDGKVAERWHSRAEAPYRIPFDDLHHLYIDPEGIFWLSTRGGGLVKFDPRSGASEQFTMRNGFPNNMVYAAYEDQAGQLWLPTDGGIVRFEKATGQSAVFTTADGITNDEFNRTAHAQGPDGRLFFGGLNGITVVDPERFSASSEVNDHPLVFTSFKRSSHSLQAQEDLTTASITGTGITLGEEDRSLEVSFAQLSYAGPGKVLYAWRMEGIDDSWNYQLSNTIRLDRLPYGTHLLEVKARSATGHWSDRVIQLPVTVQAPWHAQAPILVLLGAGLMLVLLLLVAGLRRAFTRHQRRTLRSALAPSPVAG